MLARQIGIVLCRVGAAILVVQAIRSLGYSLPGIIFAYGNVDSEILGLILLGFVPGLAAIGLWVFADRICNIQIASERDEAPSSLNGVDIIRVGTILIGVYVVIAGATSGVNTEVINLMRPDLGGEYQSMIEEQVARTIGDRASYIAQILLGVALILGRDRISAFFMSAKHAAVDTSR